ncbi:hypothetical protein [Pseudomonas sp. GD03730]|uniref:hypothetical protein n=1 Tax=Pseudomonas sp. GD03730 TaxID=2975375 RepID=UPI00244A80C2|nr:hypothetical protein [Pseudomonas sp. GD03730]MDH1403704.1 hypothetical protein [Pseudomonas sp. GD03730]
MTDTDRTEYVLNSITLAMATTFLDDLGDPGRYEGEVGILRQLVEAAKDQHAVETAEEAVKPGLYAIRHIDNWCGDRDVRTSLATYDKDGKWRYDENGAQVLDYDGDRILQAWPLDHTGEQALTYDAGLAAATTAIRAIMDEFREEHSERDPAPGTSGMSEQHQATYYAMYELEKAVRMLKGENPLPLPVPPALDLKKGRRDFEVWYLQAHGVENVHMRYKKAISQREMLARFNPTDRTDSRWVFSMRMLWEQWLKCQETAHMMQTMDTAPRDGTRILARCITYGYYREHGGYVATGEQWIECWYCDGEFKPWCGSAQAGTTESLDPVGWIHLPGSHQP